LEENLDLCHILHAAHTIIVSRTLPDDFSFGTRHSHTPVPHIARSFAEALVLARQLVGDLECAETFSPDCTNILCWIAGGERLYNQAVLHPSATRLHLTIVDTEIDIADAEIARFPAAYRWDNKFKEVYRQEKVSQKGDIGLKFEYYVYERLKGVR
jgi:dihydrofolate reductase